MNVDKLENLAEKVLHWIVLIAVVLSIMTLAVLFMFATASALAAPPEKVVAERYTNMCQHPTVSFIQMAC